MKTKPILLVLAASAVIVVMGGAGYALYIMGTRHADPAAAGSTTASTSPVADMNSIAAGEPRVATSKTASKPVIPTP